jgi:hypothetical protein
MAFGNRHALSAQRGPRGSERLYIFITTPDEHFASTCSLKGERVGAAKSKLIGENTPLGSWGPKTKDLVTVACDEESFSNPDAKVDIRPLYQLPGMGGWEHNPSAIVIGDAAHLMTPNGEGVNIAMFDALRLSQAIVKMHEAPV